MIDEIWKTIPSLNGKYEASSYGNIRNSDTGYVLKQFTNRFGYKTLQVCPSPGVKQNARVHRLIAEAFLGACPSGMVVNHKDGNKANNFVENLEYVTSSDNNIHALENGLRHSAKMSGLVPHGEDHYNVKISEDIVEKIWGIRNKFGYGSRKIAKILGISNGIVSGVLYRNNWSYTKLKGE